MLTAVKLDCIEATRRRSTVLPMLQDCASKFGPMVDAPGATAIASPASTRMLSLGTYPQVSLAEARKRRDEARTVLQSGRDPSSERKAKKFA